MSNFKAGDVVRAKVGCSPYFKSGDIGVVVDIEYLDGKIAFLHVDFNRAGQYAYEDGRWYLAPEEAAPWLGITKPALSGHSGEHDGLQNHSVGSAYPLAVVTYGHAPAIHVIENLKDGTVLCNSAGKPVQNTDASYIFQVLTHLTRGTTTASAWRAGRPTNENGVLVIKEPEAAKPQHRLFDALLAETKRIGRDLTPFEVYQTCCDVDNR